MPSLIEIRHNPYIPQLSILIDGERPTEFSRLVQFSDEDIWIWYKDILDVIFAEIRNEFVLKFTGTTFDASVMEFICKQHKFCRGFKASDFVISEPLQSRMKQLNQYIKRNGLTQYKRTIIDASFVLFPETQSYWDDISEIDINNLFCSVRISAASPTIRNIESDFVIVLSKDAESVATWLNGLTYDGHIFVLLVAEQSGIVTVSEKAWYIGSTPNDLLSSIFQCFLEMPLLLAFRRCVKSISDGKKSDELRKIVGIESLVNIQVSSKIEVGKSAQIIVKTDPPLVTKPKLIYKILNQDVASCDSLCVFGKSKGIATLEVYKDGERKPFETVDIEVYERNRIRKLILSDDNLVLGEGDRRLLKCDYSPQNADNVAAISWTSSDEEIVSVDKSGNLCAKHEGHCRIICTAENVSAQCHCSVKPYLQSIEVDLPFEEGCLSMKPLDELVMPIVLTPPDSYDSAISISSSNQDVVNVVKNTLYAKNVGQAIISIHNATKRHSFDFTVLVAAEKKAGFFKSLFSKKGREK